MLENDYLEPGSITWRQAEELRRLLPEGTPIGHLSRYQAPGLIKLHDPNARWRREPPTRSQEDFLRGRGLWREGLTRGEASDLIGQAIERERHPPGTTRPETTPGAPPEIGTSRRAGSAGRYPYGDGPSRRGF
jgi:hypothetical protein